MEVSLPGMNPDSVKRPIFTDYVKNIFNFAIGISAVVVFGVIVFSGFKIIAEANNPGVLAEAKEKVLNAGIGLVVILSSYLILNTINPQLVLINPQLKGVRQGITLYQKNPADSTYNSQKDMMLIAKSEQDLGSFVPRFYQFNTDPKDLKVFIYSDKNFKPDPGEKLADSLTVASFPGSAKSIKLDFQYPGVYLCKYASDAGKEICTAYAVSSPNIEKDGLEDKVDFIKFKNPVVYDSSIPQSECTPAKGRQYFPEQKTCGYFSQQYGAILHEGRNYKNTCKEFLTDGPIDTAKGKTNVFPGDPSKEGVSSITVFLQSKEKPTKGGVTLYELENYTETQVQKDNSVKIFYEFPYSSDLNKYYKDLELYRYEDKEDVDDSALSLKIDGNYMALLFKNKNFQHNCEIVSADDPNLGVDNYVGKEVSSLKVIPIQK